MRKSIKKGIAGVAVALACVAAPLAGGGLLAGCGDDDGEYNIIAAEASVPPVIAALESIKSGKKTYAYIERGKTYAGIESVSRFENLGFDTGNNASRDVVLEMNSKVKDTIEKIKSRNEDATFTIYCRDYSALSVYALAVRAGLEDDDFKLVMIEDGSGAYSSVYNNYVKDLTKTEENQDPGYKKFQDRVDSCQALLKTIRDSHGENGYVLQSYETPLALAACGNFSYIFQSKVGLKNQLDKNPALEGSALYAALGLEESEEELIDANIKFQSISEYVNSLNSKQKDTYLTLMFGPDRAVTDKLFTRTKVGKTAVPEKKLVYIGSRVAGGNVVSVGNMTSLDELTANYADLDEKYKEVFLTEADYKLVYNKVNKSTMDDRAKLAAVNTYLNYVYGLKLTLRLYGDEYDILFKGHPSEVVSNYGAWEDARYQFATGIEGENPLNYKKLIFDLVQEFYANDSEGKLIGILPGGVAAENFAYLGYDFALGGLTSSTYQGYESDIVVEFVYLAGKNTLASNAILQARKDNGTLTWTKGEDENYTTSILNQGRVYKELAELYKTDHPEFSAKYEQAYKAWLIENSEQVTQENVEQYTVDTYGNIVEKA